MHQENRTLLSFIGLVSTVMVSAVGCTSYLIEIDRLVPDPPPLAQAAPRLHNLTVTPSTLTSGGYTTVTIKFDYEDWNRDVGPDKALIWRHLEVLSGNLAFDSPTHEFWVRVDSADIYGFVSFQMIFYVPSRGAGEIGLYLALYDRYGNKSTSVVAILVVR